MSLLVILMIGAILGWVASIMMGSDRLHGVTANVGVGVAGAFAAGALASGPTLMTGLTMLSLAFTCGGALVLLAVMNLVWHSSEELRDRRR